MFCISHGSPGMQLIILYAYREESSQLFKGEVNKVVCATTRQRLMGDAERSLEADV